MESEPQQPLVPPGSPLECHQFAKWELPPLPPGFHLRSRVVCIEFTSLPKCSFTTGLR